MLDGMPVGVQTGYKKLLLTIREIKHGFGNLKLKILSTTDKRMNEL